MPGEAEKLVSSSKSSRETDKGAQCDIQGGAVTVRPRWKAAETRAPETGRRAKRGRLEGGDDGRRVLTNKICPVGDSAPAVEASWGRTRPGGGAGRWEVDIMSLQALDVKVGLLALGRCS